MHSSFNRASAALSCTACSLEVPGFLRPVALGRVSGWVLVGLKLPVTPGNHRLQRGRCECQWGLKEKRGLSTCTAQSSSSDLYLRWQCVLHTNILLSLPVLLGTGSFGCTWESGERAIRKLQKGGINHTAAGLPNRRCWYFKTKNPFASTSLQVPKMQQWLFWEILAFCCFSQWSTELFFFIGLEKNIPPSQHTFKQTTNSEI